MKFTDSLDNARTSIPEETHQQETTASGVLILRGEPGKPLGNQGR